LAASLLKRLTEPGDLFDQTSFFPIYVRGNQGFNVALVMRRFPNLKILITENNLFTVVAASLVPRFLWPDKPEAGGKI